MRIVYAILALLILPCAHAVVIQEVYPDPIGTDTGGEAVLLYNNALDDVDVGGWTLGTPSSITDATIPSGTLLATHQLYLLADAGWSVDKDSAAWADASHEEAITLSNSGGTVTLRDNNGTIVDSVTYPAAEPGIAYWRQGGSLTATEPLFSAPLDALYSLALEGSTEGNAPLDNGSCSMSITENGKRVTKTRPLAGNVKLVNATIHSVSEPVVTFLGKSYLPALIGNNTYLAPLEINYSTPPGTYNITAFADTILTAPLEILPLLAMDSDADLLVLGASTQHTVTIEGDDEYGTDAPTLRNIGNVPIDIWLSRTSLRINTTRVSGNVSAQADGAAVLVSSTAQHLTTLQPGQTAPLSLTITLPENVPNGDYTTNLAFQLKQGQ